MKILVVHEVSYEKKVIYEIHEFPELLSLRGHDVTFFDFDEGAKKSDLSLPRDRKVFGRVHEQASIRVVTPHRWGIPLIDRYWAIFSSIPDLWKLLKNGKYDVVLNYAVPTFGVQVMLIAKFFGVPVMHRALDVASKIRQSIWNPLIFLFEKACFFMADLVSTNNPAMSEYVSQTIGKAHSQEIHLHYPPLDKNILKPVERDIELAKNLGLSTNDRVLVYMGSFFYFSGLDQVLREFAKMKQSEGLPKLLLIGGGEQESLLREIVKDSDLTSHVIFTGFVGFGDLPRYMRLADVAISPLEVSLVASAAFPNKVLQYMAVELPTVSTKLDGLYQAFGDTSGIRWVSSPDKVVEAALEILASDQDSIADQIFAQSQALDQLFSPEITVMKLEEALLELKHQGRRYS